MHSWYLAVRNCSEWLDDYDGFSQNISDIVHTGHSSCSDEMKSSDCVAMTRIHYLMVKLSAAKMRS